MVPYYYMIDDQANQIHESVTANSKIRDNFKVFYNKDVGNKLNKNLL